MLLYSSFPTQWWCSLQLQTLACKYFQISDRNVSALHHVSISSSSSSSHKRPWTDHSCCFPLFSSVRRVRDVGLVSYVFMVIFRWRLVWQHISLSDSEEMQLAGEENAEGALHWSFITPPFLNVAWMQKKTTKTFHLTLFHYTVTFVLWCDCDLWLTHLHNLWTLAASAESFYLSVSALLFVATASERQDGESFSYLNTELSLSAVTAMSSLTQ